MGAWDDTGTQTSARSRAVIGLPDGDLDEGMMVLGHFSPAVQIRKMLHGLIEPEEMDEVVDSCVAVACNAHRITVLVGGPPANQVGSLACLIAQVIAHGVLYGHKTRPGG